MMKENWVYRRGDIYCADLDPVTSLFAGDFPTSDDTTFL